MKIKFILLLYLIFFILPKKIIAQEIQDYLPKAPEASELDKYINIPPGSYTGVAGYSVPLYTITVDGYSIPVTLNYHGMGIKVNDVSSSVGLGWSLSIAGISLSQQVIGEQDEFTTQLDVNLFEFDPTWSSNPQALGQNYRDAFLMCNLDAQGLDVHSYVSLELQPDYYSYSLLNNSGKFIIDSQGTGHTIPKDDVKIITPAVLVDNQGIKYTFLPKYNNYSITIQGSSASSSQLPSYNIEKITFPSGKEITFNYVDSSHDYLANYIETERIFAGGDYSLCGGQEVSVLTPRYILNEDVLSSISFENGEIDFLYNSAERQDIGGKELNYVIVKNNNGGIFRDYEIINSYTTSPSDIMVNYTQDDGIYYNGIFKRLILNEVKELISNKSYKFDYFDDYVMPNRFSTSVDFWGSYNGKPNRSYIHQYSYTDNDGYLRIKEGADKNPVLDYAKTASLKTVHLPTGGIQEFEYELDDYKFDDVENLFYADNQQLTATSTALNANGVVEMPLTVSTLDYRDGFDYRFEFYWNNNPLADDGATNDNGQINLPEDDDYLIAYLLDENNNIIQPLYHNITVEIPPLNPNTNYKIRIEKRGNAPNSGDTIFAKLHWYQNNPVYIANKNTGNLRVKSITLKDQNEATLLQRNYTYKNPLETQLSSGFYSDFSKYTITESPADDNGHSCIHKNISSTFSGNVSSFRGKSVVYEYVTEEYLNYEDPTKTYYNQKQFSLPPLYVIDYSQVPRVPDVDRSFYGGLLINEQKLDNQHNKVLDITNSYALDPYFASQSSDHDQGVPIDGLSGGINIAVKGYVRYLSGDLNLPPTYIYNAVWYNWTDYYYPTRWVRLDESTTTSYFNNGANSVEQKTTYTYDNNYQHIKPVLQTTTDSDGKTVTVNYQYPQDDVSEPHAQDLINANRVSIPLVTTTTRDDDFVRQRTVFEDWGNGILNPQTVEIQKGTFNVFNGTNGLEPRITYHNYDTYGNPLEVSKTDGTHIIYVWGYNDTQPIAKIENASYDDLDEAQESAIDAIKLASNSDVDTCIGITGCSEANLRDALNTLRDVFPKSMVTTYTYNPLVGVTSITDPRGQMVYYVYDAFNRLKHVKDKDGNILSENQYNYRTDE